MKIRSLFLSLPLLVIPTLVQASNNVKHGSSAILFLQQLSDLSGSQLPQDILTLLGQTLNILDAKGGWYPEGNGQKWIPTTTIVEGIKTFRDDSESSKAEIMAILEFKEHIKEGLLLALSAEWNGNLEGLVKEHRHDNGKLSSGKAYAAAFFAYTLIELSAASDGASSAAMATDKLAGRKAARKAAWIVARRAALKADFSVVSEAAYNTALEAAVEPAWTPAKQASSKAVQSPIEQKLAVLGFPSAAQISAISYDLGELFALLWLLENGHKYEKKAFDAAYENWPEMELAEVKAAIKALIDAAAIKNPELEDNMFINALWRNLDAMEKFVLAK